MNNNKILILGAGNAQIDAIKYCKSKGYIVYGCSYTNNDNGIQYLDHFKQIDIKDVEAVKAYMLEEDIRYVYSVGSDLAMPCVTRVCEELKYPSFISSQTAKICQNKGMMREKLGADFKGNAAYITASTVEKAMEYAVFPAMMKPVDSQGQRGCFKVDSVNDIKAYFNKSHSYSKSGHVIIEQYVDGPEVSINAYMYNGKMIFSLMSDRIVFEDLPGGIIKKHLVPTQYSEVEEKTKDLVYRVAKKIGIDNGPLYAQIKLEKGEPILLEITPRLDGCHMWNLIKHYCNVDLLECTFEHLLNGEPKILCEQRRNTELKLEFFCEQPGKFFDKTKCVASVEQEYQFCYYKDGEVVKELNGYMEKCGYYIGEN